LKNPKTVATEKSKFNKNPQIVFQKARLSGQKINKNSKIEGNPKNSPWPLPWRILHSFIFTIRDCVFSWFCDFDFHILFY